MPELPEVEVSRLGIQPHALGQVVTRIDVRQPSLRWPVPENIHDMEGQEIRAVKRRAKYLSLKRMPVRRSFIWACQAASGCSMATFRRPSTIMSICTSVMAR